MIEETRQQKDAKDESDGRLASFLEAGLLFLSLGALIPQVRALINQAFVWLLPGTLLVLLLVTTRRCWIGFIQGMSDAQHGRT